jgi:ribonuclease T1
VVINEKGVVKNVDKATEQAIQNAEIASRASLRFPSRLRSWLGVALAAVALSGLGVPTPSMARPSFTLADPVSLADLPPEARKTDQSIRAGGPFPFPRDGIVFGNREKRLEREPRGYYHEYTVPTPGARNRGARRIICGGTEPTEPDACFYTEDHYNSFHRIVK